MFENMKSLFVVNKETAESKEKAYNDRLFSLTEANKQRIGEKVFASIPVELLKVDESYQRIHTYNEDTLRRLIAKFNKDKMDPLVVVIHEEEKRYYIIDGMHRWLAALALGITELECVIIVIKGTPEERRKEEARRFIDQGNEVENVTPLQKHAGKVICGEKEYKILDEVVNELDEIHFKENENSRGKQPIGTLTGYVQAVKIARKGKAHLKDVFDVLISAGWYKETTGLGNNALRMVSHVLLTHDQPEVKAECARILRRYEPRLFMATAQAAYLTRKPSNANDLYLEDCVCTNLGIERLIDKDDKTLVRIDPVA